ncbi:glycosyltransferase [Streptococcus thermophilus]|nr:glycosyltransferase [Streptococcus thermophilus]
MIKNMDYLVSVIVPIYKVEKDLSDCVLSICNQTYTNLEIILVDDGSPDNCGQMCDEFAKNDVRIKVIHKINGGLSQARNAGMSIMTGDYITFVDSDDILEHEFIEEMLRIINKYNAQVAICKNSTFEKGGTLNNGHVGISERSFDAVEAIKNMLYQKDFDVAAWGKMYIKKYENALNERGYSMT